MLSLRDTSLFAFVLFYVFRRPRGVISTPVIRTFGRGGRYYGRGYKNQGAIQVIAPCSASASSVLGACSARPVFQGPWPERGALEGFWPNSGTWWFSNVPSLKPTFPQTQTVLASCGVKRVSSCSRAVPGNLAENNPEAVNAIYIINHHLGESHLGFKKKLWLCKC